MSSKHLPALDGVRGFAVLMIVCFHTAGGAQSSIRIVALLGELNHYGWTAVTLFFVLSGFLITGILNDTRDDPHRLRNFYARRFLRIFPLYYAALALALLAAIPTQAFHACLAHLPVFLLYLQNVQPFDLHPAPLASPLRVSHFWTLAVEEQFYLLWPFLVYRAKSLRATGWLCTAVVVASTVYKFALPHANGDSLAVNSGALALGGLLAIFYRTGYWQQVSQFAELFCLLCFTVLLALYSHGHVLDAPGLTALPAACASLIALTLVPGPAQWLFSVRWLRWIGSISYGIYIYHLLFLGAVDFLTILVAPELDYSAHLALRFLLSLATTIFVSWLSYRFFESPILRLKRHFQYRNGNPQKLP